MTYPYHNPKFEAGSWSLAVPNTDASSSEFLGEDLDDDQDEVAWDDDNRREVPSTEKCVGSMYYCEFILSAPRTVT